jgi:hypothetical protein
MKKLIFDISKTDRPRGLKLRDNKILLTINKYTGLVNEGTKVHFPLFSVHFDLESPIASIWLNKQTRNTTNFSLDNWSPDQN